MRRSPSFSSCWLTGRGGGRVIYYWRTAENQILLVTVFAKNVKVNLTPAEVKALAKAYAG